MFNKGLQNGKNLFEAICAGFNTVPEVCIEEFHFEKKDQSISIWMILLIILVILFNLLIFVLCKRYLNKSVLNQIESKELNFKIQEIVSSYIKNKEEKFLSDKN